MAYNKMAYNIFSTNSLIFLLLLDVTVFLPFLLVVLRANGTKFAYFRAKLEKFKKQDYYKLKKHHERSGTLFTDPLFPANEASLFFTRRPPGRIEWKRPGVS